MFKKNALAAILAAASIAVSSANDSHDSAADDNWCQQNYGRTCAEQEQYEEDQRQRNRAVGSVRG